MYLRMILILMFALLQISCKGSPSSFYSGKVDNIKDSPNNPAEEANQENSTEIQPTEEEEPEQTEPDGATGGEPIPPSQPTHEKVNEATDSFVKTGKESARCCTIFSKVAHTACLNSAESLRNYMQTSSAEGKFKRAELAESAASICESLACLGACWSKTSADMHDIFDEEVVVMEVQEDGTIKEQSPQSPGPSGIDNSTFKLDEGAAQSSSPVSASISTSQPEPSEKQEEDSSNVSPSSPQAVKSARTRGKSKLQRQGAVEGN